MIRLLLILTLTVSMANATEIDDISGTWTIDKHIMVFRNDGTFFANGYEPEIDDQFGTYEIRGGRLYLTYTMYGRLVYADYGLGLEKGKLLLHDMQGVTLEYARQNSDPQ